MRKIEFIAPVEAMRGNLSGNQDLKYAKNDNPAFDAPNGKQYAKNFQTRFIGAKRASDGLKYFNVRTKSSVQINDESKKVMACLGGTQAVYSAIIKQHASEIPQITSYFNWFISTFGHGPSVDGKQAKDVKHWIFLNAYRCLNNKAKNFTFSGPSTGGSVTFHNPWSIETPITSSLELNLSTYILTKFWMQLAKNAVEIVIDNMAGYPELPKKLSILTATGEKWSEFMASARNTVGLENATTLTNGIRYPITLADGGEYCVDIIGGDFALKTATIDASKQYYYSYHNEE